MDKITLLRYLYGELGTEQKQEVLDWVNANKENEQYFIALMNLYATQTLSDEKASEAEYAGMVKIIRQKEMAEQRGEETRSGRILDKAQEHGSHIFKKLFWIAAAAVVLLVVTNLFLLSVKQETIGIQKNTIAAMMSPKNIQSYKELYTNRGVKAKLVLPDSSVVYLNSDTRISYPDRFDSLSRNVRIEGEAYFKVTKDTMRPMIVTTGKGFAVRVLGTEFNLRANADDADAQATLYSGKIDIIREKGGKVVITNVQPNETVTIGNDNVCSKIVRNEPQKLMAWREGKLIFDHTPVGEAVKMLQRWHGVEIEVADASILDFRLTATFEQESIVQILELLKIITYIDYKIEGKHVTLTRR